MTRAPKERSGLLSHLICFYSACSPGLLAQSKPNLNHISGLNSIESLLNLMSHLEKNPAFAQIPNSAIRAPGWFSG